MPPPAKAPLDLLGQLRALQQSVEELQADLAALQDERAVMRAQIASMQMSLAGFRRMRRIKGEDAVVPARGLVDLCAEIAGQFDVPADALRGGHRSVLLGRARYAFCEAAVQAGWEHGEVAYFMGGRPASMVANILCRGRKAAE